MRKRIEKGISIKPEKSQINTVYVSKAQFGALEKARKEGYSTYLEELKKGHPMAL